jgi:hypothetical protein
MAAFKGDAPPYNLRTTEKQAMSWYNSLTINQKINVKEHFLLLCGISWDLMADMFSFKERIKLFYDKLKIEGFDV